jgi:anti-anti-sigma factor
MRAGLARAPAIGTIQAVRPDATIRGTLDVDDARELERRLRDVVLGGKRTVIVELSSVDELSSSLVGVLIRTQRSINWRNGRLLIACESAAIRHQLADLNELFEFVDERPQRR